MLPPTIIKKLKRTSVKMRLFNVKTYVYTIAEIDQVIKDRETVHF